MTRSVHFFAMPLAWLTAARRRPDIQIVVVSENAAPMQNAHKAVMRRPHRRHPRRVGAHDRRWRLGWPARGAERGWPPFPLHPDRSATPACHPHGNRDGPSARPDGRAPTWAPFCGDTQDE
eukprot:5536059-Pyramimonas_sp.AAC.1